MDTRNTYFIIFLGLFSLLTACNDEARVKSSTEDRVTVSAPAKKFVLAYEKAKNECQKYERTALYAPYEFDGLGEVAFDCLAPEVEEEVAAAETEATEEEVVSEAEEIPAEVEAETEITEETETAPAE